MLHLAGQPAQFCSVAGEYFISPEVPEYVELYLQIEMEHLQPLGEP
jgi:hypothetical protein